MRKHAVLRLLAATMALVAGQALAKGKAAKGAAGHEEHEEHGEAPSGPVCEGFGPQAPRDIDAKAGENAVTFQVAPKYQELNLCNLHFHNQAEHKAADFSLYAGPGEHGHGGGYQCASSKKLTAAERKAPAGDICKGLKPGDTVEVHWVHTSCDVKPGKGLGACVNDACKEPKLRVEAQVFTLVNDAKALSFGDLVLAENKVNDRYQAKTIPSGTGTPVEFLGSTTGPSYSDQNCSTYKATWSVRPKCAKLDINSLGAWCKGNVFEEDHAHGVRKLVTHPKLLSPIGAR